MAVEELDVALEAVHPFRREGEPRLHQPFAVGPAGKYRLGLWQLRRRAGQPVD
jgi:hypothetical protein